MRSRLPIFLFSVFAGAVVAGAWLFVRSHHVAGPVSKEDSTPGLDKTYSDSGGEHVVVERSDLIADEAPDVGKRAATPAPGIAGIVLAAGSVVEGARVKCVELPSPSFDATYSWASAASQGSSLSTVTDVRGQFAFSDRPSWLLENDAVIWVIAPDHEPVPVLVAAGDERTWHQVQLEAKAPINVVVVDSEGASVPAADVFVAGIYPDRSASRTSFVSRAYQAFRIEGRASAQGSWLTPALSGLQAIWAVHGTLRSEVWIGRGADSHQVSLQLQPSFELLGTVTSEESVELDHELGITIATLAGSHSELAARLTVNESGQWGPVHLPAGIGYQVKASGGDFLPVEEQISSASMGDRVRLDMVVTRGAVLPFRVTDEAGEPIVNAQLSVQWADYAETRGGIATSFSNDEGYVEVGGCPNTTLAVRVEADGFVDFEGWYELDDPLDVDLETVALKRGGVIRGRCTHEGQPVSDFDVSYWSGHPGMNRMSETSAGVDDGRFELRGVPIGEVGIFAASRLYPRSEVKIVHVSWDVPAEVELELPDPVVGEGRVVDNVTGQPIADARVQIYSAYRGNYFDPWGPGHSVDDNGYFRIKGFAPQDTRFIASAPGYADWLGEGFGVPGEVMDLGVISLARNQVLTIRLSGGADFSGYQVAPVGNQYYPTQGFDSEGVTQYPQAGPGSYAIRVDCPDASIKFFEDYLYSGEDWTYDVPVGRGRELSVRVTSDESPLEESGVAYA